MDKNLVIRNFLKLSHDVRELTEWMTEAMPKLEALRTDEISGENFEDWVNETCPGNRMVFLKLGTGELLFDDL